MKYLDRYLRPPNENWRFAKENVRLEVIGRDLSAAGVRAGTVAENHRYSRQNKGLTSCWAQYGGALRLSMLRSIPPVKQGKIDALKSRGQSSKHQNELPRTGLLIRTSGKCDQHFLLADFLHQVLRQQPFSAFLGGAREYNNEEASEILGSR